MPRDRGRLPRTPPEYLVTFNLGNVCFTPFDDHYTRFRGSFIALGRTHEAVVHGFTEYTQGYQRLTSVRSEGTSSPGTRR